MPTEVTKQQAETLAKSVTGVSRVENRLEVKVDTDTTRVRAADDPSSPSWITTKIHAKYYTSPALKPWRIDVTTSRAGVVTLEGRVDSAADRAEAVRLARETDGVKDVRDMLRVSGDTPERAAAGSAARTVDRAGDRAADTADDAGDTMSDGWITTKIQSRYFMDGDVRGRKIDVDTTNGVVTLSGTVGSALEKQQAVAIARRTDGVTDVRDNLRVQAEPGRAGVRTTGSAEKVDDSWVTTKVQSKYFFDDAVQGTDIDVTTQNGVVTLTGTVPSAAAKANAVRLARDTEGVRSVRDNLKVAPAATR